MMHEQRWAGARDVVPEVSVVNSGDGHRHLDILAGD